MRFLTEPFFNLAGPLVALRTRFTALSGWRRRGAAFSLGLMAALSLPPLYIFPLLIVGLTGLVWLIDPSRPKLASFGAGWWWGFGHFIIAFYWIAESFLVDPLRFGWMIPFAIGGLAAYMALFIALVSFVTRLLGLAGSAKVLAFAVLWATGEWLRGHLLSGFPWDLAGYTVAFSDALNQYAALGGIWGLSLLVVIVAAMPATLGDPSRPGFISCSAAILVVILVAAGGALRLRGPTEMLPGVVLRIVQPNIAQTDKWIPGSGEQHVTLLSSITSQMPSTEKISAVIWPETAVQFLLDGNMPLRQFLGRQLPLGAVLLTGTFRKDEQLFNSLLVVDHDGNLLGSADKFHLVPMGEYVPLHQLFPFITKLAPSPEDFGAGSGPTSINLPNLPTVGVLICYEAIFPGAVVDPNHRPQWLVNVTNDAWFGTSSGPYQHFTSARIRAVEEGLPLVRVANTGISALVDPYGRVSNLIGLDRLGVRDVGLPQALSPLTPYARFGDWMFLLQLLIVGSVAVSLRRWR